MPSPERTGAAAPSLRRRLARAMLLFMTAGALTGGLLVIYERLTPEEVIEHTTLSMQADDLTAALRFSGSVLAPVSPPSDWAETYRRPGAAYFAIYDAAGSLVAASGNRSPLPRLAGPPDRIQAVGDDQALAIARPLDAGHLLVVGRSPPAVLEQEGEGLLEMLAPFAFALSLILGGAAMVWAVAGWSLRPLAAASAEAARIRPGDTATRLSTANMPAELAPLIDAINGALARLADAYAHERRLTADVSHALRTPLAVLDLRLQRAERTNRVDWPAVRGDLAQLRQITGQLLALAGRAPHEGATAAFETIDLGRVLRESAAGLLPLVDERGRSLSLDGPEHCPITGDAAALRDVFGNLIENALVHGAGEIAIQLDTGGGGFAVVTVEDQGPGTPETERESVFERFAKAANSPGAGLGLTIARRIARAHGGDARFIAAARIEVRLPKSAA